MILTARSPREGPGHSRSQENDPGPRPLLEAAILTARSPGEGPGHSRSQENDPEPRPGPGGRRGHHGPTVVLLEGGASSPIRSIALAPCCRRRRSSRPGAPERAQGIAGARGRTQGPSQGREAAGPTVVLLEGSGGALHYMFESHSTRATPKRPESRPARLFAKVHINEHRKSPGFCVRKGYKNI